MESVSRIKTVCRADAAVEPPWMAYLACLDPAYRFYVRIAGWPETPLPLTFQLHSLQVDGAVIPGTGMDICRNV